MWSKGGEQKGGKHLASLLKSSQISQWGIFFIYLSWADALPNSCTFCCLGESHPYFRSKKRRTQVGEAWGKRSLKRYIYHHLLSAFSFYSSVLIKIGSGLWATQRHSEMQIYSDSALMNMNIIHRLSRFIQVTWYANIFWLWSDSHWTCSSFFYIDCQQISQCKEKVY